MNIKILVVAVVVILIAVGLSGCLDESVPIFGLPSDEECLQKISDYLNKHSNFYDSTDTIYLDDWTGVVCQTRVFDWCHNDGYCGLGSINCIGEVSYEGGE